MKGLIFDTETTGFKDPVIIEAAGIHFDVEGDLEHIGDSWCYRFNPGKPIELGAMATHHIMDEELVDCPPASSFLLPGNVEYLIGHSIDYDWNAIGQPPVKRICTYAMSCLAWPELDSHSQSALTYYLNRENARSILKHAHSALADVRICQIIVGALGQHFGTTSLEQMWEVSEDARVPRVMKFGKHEGTLIEDLPFSYVVWFMKQDDVDPYLMKAFEKRVG